jgi:hypothetical protein
MIDYSKEARILMDLGFTYEQSFAVIRGLHQSYFIGTETNKRTIDSFKEDAIEDSITAIETYLKD